MAGAAASLELTAAEVHQLTAWVRAGTTPQSLVRRARVILGSAAGVGQPRAGAPRAPESHHGAPLAHPFPSPALQRIAGSPATRSTAGDQTQHACAGGGTGL